MAEQDEEENEREKFYLDLAREKRSVFLDVPMQIAGGVRDAAQSALDLTARGAEWMNDKIPLGSVQWGDDGFSWTSESIPIEMPEIAEADTGVGSAARGISQFMTGFIPGMQAARAMKVGQGAAALAARFGLSSTAANAVGLYARTELASQMADQIVFDPHGSRLSNLVQEVPALQNPVTEYLAADPEDSEAEARFKMSLEGMGLGAITGGIIQTAKRTGQMLHRHWSRPSAVIASEQSEQAAIAALKETDPERLIRTSAESDMAFNINLNHLDTEDNIKGAIEAFSERFQGSIDDARRGTITQQQTHALADDLGMRVEDLLNRKTGEAWNAEQILAARQMLVTSGEDLVTKAQKVVGGDDTTEALLEFRRSLSLHSAIQHQVSGLAAETGRALRQFNYQAEGTRAMRELLEGFGGRGTLEDLAGKVLTTAEAGGRQGLNGLTRRITDRTWRKQAFELWINGLLSGPHTHAVNMISNTMTSGLTIAEHFLASGIGAVRELATGGVRGLAESTDRVTLQEAMARANGFIQGSIDGVRLAKQAFMTEESVFGAARQFDLDTVAARGEQIPGRVGQAIRLPTRLLGAEDEFFKSIGFRMELNSLAYRDGLARNLRGEDLAEHVAGLVRDPPKSLVDEAIEGATYVTYTRPLGQAGKRITQTINDIPGGRVIVPFIRTPTNIAKFALERTPLGGAWREMLGGIDEGATKAQRDLYRARYLLGTSMAVGTVALAANGLITGGGPQDRIARAALLDTGWQPYSFRFGDKYYSYARFEPIAMVVGLAADYAEISGHTDERQNMNMAAAVLGSISQNLTSKTFLRGISDALEAFNDPQRYGEQYISSMAGTIVPTGIAQIARINDPVMRDARGVVDRIRSRIPGFSDDLPARRNLWGEIISYEGSLGPDMATPVYQSTRTNDFVSYEFQRLNVRRGLPSRRLGGEELSQQDYWQYVEEAGKLAKSTIEPLLFDPAYDNMNDDMKRELFERVIRDTRSVARRQLQMRILQRQADTENEE